MVGNIDTEEDWLATGLALRGGIRPVGCDSRSFLTGHYLGFILGYICAQKQATSAHGTQRIILGANAAYQEAIAHVRKEDSFSPGAPVAEGNKP